MILFPTDKTEVKKFISSTLVHETFKLQKESSNSLKLILSAEEEMKFNENPIAQIHVPSES